MIASHNDLLAAYDDGRFHSQRFIKTGAGQANDTRWQDWSFQAGQPAYDPRIGTTCTFTPVVATKNDAIWFPDISPGMERKLHKLTMYTKASNNNQLSVDFVLYDLVGYYPLIDGDSTEPQDMDNTLSLPRYATGEGVKLVVVSHVSPAVQGGAMLLDYTDSDGVDRQINTGVSLNGINTVCSAAINSPLTQIGPLAVGLGTGVKGIQRVNRVTYTTAPGGLHCLYLIRPLAQFMLVQDVLVQGQYEKSAVEIDFALKDGWRMPDIKDGAHLSFFYRANGSGRSNSFFGMADFVWN